MRGERSFFPAPGSHLLGKARITNLPRDFNGTSRHGSADAGAYRFDPKGNPGWKVSAGFKK